MKYLILLSVAISACTSQPNGSASQNDTAMPSNLNVAYCQKIAEETRRSGKLNLNLCPGYMQDGYPVELFI